MATPTLLSPLEVLRQFDAHDFSIDQFFQARLRRLSEQPMVEYQGSVTTWQSCAEQADHAVGWLLGRGVQAGDRIELYRPLKVDPKVARRQRFKRQGKGRTGLFANRKSGSTAGY